MTADSEASPGRFQFLRRPRFWIVTVLAALLLSWFSQWWGYTQFSYPASTGGGWPFEWHHIESYTPREVVTYDWGMFLKNSLAWFGMVLGLRVYMGLVRHPKKKKPKLKAS